MALHSSADGQRTAVAAAAPAAVGSTQTVRDNTSTYFPNKCRIEDDTEAEMMTAPAAEMEPVPEAAVWMRTKSGTGSNHCSRVQEEEGNGAEGHWSNNS